MSGGGFGEGAYGAGPYGQGAAGTTTLDPEGPSGYGEGAFGAGPYGGTAPDGDDDQDDGIIVADFMPDIRYWLRNHPLLTDLVGGRVFFRIPRKNNISGSPFIRIYSSGGGVQSNSEAPLEDQRIAIDIWAVDNAQYPQVRKTERAITTAAQRLGAGLVIGPNGTRLHNVNVTTAFDSPDPTTGWPRRVMDAVFTLSL